MKKNCSEPPVYRYTWPGQNERFTCIEHSKQLKLMAAAVGLNLQLIALSTDDVITKECSQKTEMPHEKDKS